MMRINKKILRKLESRMKKINFLKILIFILVLISLTACENGTLEKIKSDSDAPAGLKEITGKIYQVETNKDGNIIIDKDKITEEVSYYSYEYEGVIIGLLAVKDENGKFHIVINTCGSCGGSPYAYFVQVGNRIQCQNCGNTFLISELDNLVTDGCNPISIEKLEEQDDKFIIDHEEIEQYKNKFENWQGPTKT